MLVILQRIGQLTLSERDVLPAATLEHGAERDLRLQVLWRMVIGGAPRTVPGTKGVILPLAAVGAVAELLRQTLTSAERPPSRADRLRDVFVGE